MTTTRSASSTASVMEWVTNRMVFGWSVQMRKISSAISSRVSASRAPKGSSISRMLGSWIKARQMAARCCMPPESSRGYLPSNPFSPTMLSRRRACPLLSACSRCIILSGNSTLSRIVAQGSSTGIWKTMPVSWRGSSTTTPSMATLPEVGRIRPDARRKRVDLPQPDGPTMVMNSLSPMVSEMSSRATTSAPSRERNTLNRRSISIMCWVETVRGDAGRTARGRSGGLASLGHEAGVDGLTRIPLGVQTLGGGDGLVGEGQPGVVDLAEAGGLRVVVKDEIDGGA